MAMASKEDTLLPVCNFRYQYKFRMAVVLKHHSMTVLILQKLALCCVVALLMAAAAAAGGWQIVHPQSRDAAGTTAYPSIRYGHTCHAYKGQLLATHGYYYDRDRSSTAWLSDTWALDAADGSYAWQRLSNHISQSDAYAAYSSGRSPRAPCGRFGHVSAVIGDALFVYGGNDGGYSRTNRDDYRPGNDFDELWRFDLLNRTWARLHPSGSGPGKRHMAGASAVQGKFILYGGIGSDRGDVWMYSPDDNAWEQLSEPVPTSDGGPGGRCGHSMVPWVTDQVVGFVVFGGQTQLQPTGNYVVNSDAWFFDLGTRRWRHLQTAPAGAGTDSAAAPLPPLAPPGHFYSAAMITSLTLSPEAAAGVRSGRARSCSAATAAGSDVSDGRAACAEESKQHPSSPTHSGGATAPAVRIRVGLFAGGSTTTPGLTCSNQAWAFTLDCAATTITWARLPDLPAPLYDNRGAAVGGAAYVFGGHLCALEHLPRPPYPYFYVNEALRLDLGLGLDQNLGPDSDRNQNWVQSRGRMAVSVAAAAQPGVGVAALLRGGVGDGEGAVACAFWPEGRGGGAGSEAGVGAAAAVTTTTRARAASVNDEL